MKLRGLIEIGDTSACLLIAVIVAAAFYPSLFNGFTNFDDNAYLTANPLVRSLAPENIRRIFTTTRPHTVFSPLVTLSFALEYQAWGLRPAGFHAVNLLLHVLNAILVFFLIRGISRSRGAAFFTGLLFAIHPLRVESVAWITERKDLLFAFFLLLALLFYVRYLKKGAGRDYLATLLMFALAVLAKMSALVLPAALLLMDWKFEARISRRRWLEKIPFAVILIVYGISSWSSLQAFSMHDPGGPPSVMLGNSIRLIPFYLQKTFWPSRLSAHYPTDMRFFMPPLWLSLLPAFVVIGGSFMALKGSRRECLWGWGFFLLTLLPAFGVIWHFFPAANRYSYLPAVGLSYITVLVILAIRKAFLRWRAAGIICLFLAFSCLALLGTITFRRCQTWKDSLTLWNDVIGKYPMIPLAYNNRALALRDAGLLDEAVADYTRAIELLPDGGFLWNRGMARLSQNQEKEAATDFHAAILADARYFRMYCGMMIHRRGAEGHERAIAMGRRVLASRPDARIHFQLAELFARSRRWPETEYHLQEAARLEPGAGEYRRALRSFLQARGRSGDQ